MKCTVTKQRTQKKARQSRVTTTFSCENGDTLTVQSKWGVGREPSPWFSVGSVHFCTFKNDSL